MQVNIFNFYSIWQTFKKKFKYKTPFLPFLVCTITIFEERQEMKSAPWTSACCVSGQVSVEGSKLLSAQKKKINKSRLFGAGGIVVYGKRSKEKAKH